MSNENLYNIRCGHCGETFQSDTFLHIELCRQCFLQQIMFATLSEVEGMSVGCTPAWRSGRIWKIDNNRLFVERF